MTPNLFDRIIAAYDPTRGAQRMAARAKMDAITSASAQFNALSGDGVGSVGGSGQTLRWWRPGTRDAASDTLRALPMQRGQSRELARTHPIAAGAINTNVDRVVGTGLALVAEPNRQVLGWSIEQAQAFKTEVQTEFSLWADSTDCDWEGDQNFYDKQGLTLRSALESGDCFTLLPDGQPSSTQPYKLRLQTLEADRCGNPKGEIDSATIAGGVKRGPDGPPLAYYIYNRHPGASILTGDLYAGQWVDRLGRSGRRRILHHFKKLRPGMPRGVPYLAPVVETIKQLGRYTEAEIQAAIVSAFFTLIIETDGGGSPAPVFGVTPDQAAVNPEVALGPAAVLGLAKGEKASFANPARPNAAFEPFVLAIVQQIGVGLGIPVELLLKQFNASYSASKAALLDAWMFFRGQRTWLARSFCQPVYETWMAEAVFLGRIQAPGFFADPLMRWAYTRAAWHGDSQGSINPKDEVEAYLAAVDGGVMTRERAEWELFGSDFYATFESKKTERRMLKDADMLPAPKAGAPAPATPAATETKPDQPPTPTPAPAPGAEAMATIAAAMATIASREPVAPSVTVNNEGAIVTVQPPNVELHAGDTHVTLPEGCVQLEAHIAQPNITVAPAQVNVTTPPVQLVQTSAPAEQEFLYNAEGDIVKTISRPFLTSN
ncbi:MAG: phage portal protein [Rhizobacter sp.]